MKQSLENVAKCLNIPVSTVERWIRQGRIPVKITNSGCVFQEKALQIWASKHNLPFSIPGKETPAELCECEDLKPTLISAMCLGGVYHNVGGDSVHEVLKSAVNHLEELSDELKNVLFEKLVEREDLTSTGIGKGVAIPHPRTPLETENQLPVIATCFLEKPIDYGAIDDLPVFVLFVLLSSSVKVHLHLLSRLAFCVRDNEFVAFLKTLPDEDALLSKIDIFEKKIDKS